MPKLECYDGTAWLPIGGSGTVTSLAITSSAGLSVLGSPVTTSGTINLTLGAELQALSAFASTGLIARTGSATYQARTITAGTGISISNGDGILGNPIIAIATIPISSLSGYPSNSSVYLNGLGQWTTPSSANMIASNNMKAYTMQDSFFIDRNSSTRVYYGQIPPSTGSTYGMTFFDPIYVSGSYGVFNRAYGFLSPSGTAGYTGSSGGNYGIWCENRIAAAEFNAMSSIKRKNILAKGTEVENEVLNLFKDISFFKYDFKDKTRDGEGVYYGVIAEELAKILPHYVDNRAKDFAPNILQECDVIGQGHGKYLLKFKDKLPFFEGTTLKLMYVRDDITVNANVEILVKKGCILQVSCNEELPTRVSIYGTYETSPNVAKLKYLELAAFVVQILVKKGNKLAERVSKLETILVGYNDKTKIS